MSAPPSTTREDHVDQRSQTTERDQNNASSGQNSSQSEGSRANMSRFQLEGDLLSRVSELVNATAASQASMQESIRSLTSSIENLVEKLGESRPAEEPFEIPAAPHSRVQQRRAKGIGTLLDRSDLNSVIKEQNAISWIDRIQGFSTDFEHYMFTRFDSYTESPKDQQVPALNLINPDNEVASIEFAEGAGGLKNRHDYEVPTLYLKDPAHKNSVITFELDSHSYREWLEDPEKHPQGCESAYKSLLRFSQWRALFLEEWPEDLNTWWGRLDAPERHCVHLRHVGKQSVGDTDFSENIYELFEAFSEPSIKWPAGEVAPTMVRHPEGDLKGSVSGLEIGEKTPNMTLIEVAYVVARLLDGIKMHDDEPWRSPVMLIEEPENMAMNFISDFCLSFDLNTSVRSLGPWNEPLKSRFAHLHINLRFLSVVAEATLKAASEDLSRSGLRRSRQKGKLVFMEYFKKTPSVVECRASVSMMARYALSPKRFQSEVLKYNIFCLKDSTRTRIHHSTTFPEKEVGEIMFRHGLAPYSHFWAPTVCFLACFINVLESWHSGWVGFLDQVHERGFPRAEVGSLLSRRTLKTLMFDSATIDSESQYQVLHLLRIANMWIEQTQQQLSTLRRQTMGLAPELRSEPGFDRIESYWDKTEAILRGYSKDLQGRIENMVKEVEDLRDSQSTTNQLKEATRSTQLNEYLFVFTVMTIIYMPLGFIASLYGNSIDVFNFTKPAQQASFGGAMGGLSLATYILAFTVIWFIRHKDRTIWAQSLWDKSKAKFEFVRFRSAKAKEEERPAGEFRPRLQPVRSGTFKRLENLGHDLWESVPRDQVQRKKSSYSAFLSVTRPGNSRKSKTWDNLV